jgi:isopropylmalate/homocitrate/citramalate synthase
MTSNQIVLRVIDALDRAGISYMLVGSYSSNVHGIPRATQDADFVIELSSDASIGAVASALAPDMKLDPQVLFETVTGNLRYVITHLQSAFTVELFLLTGDAHNQERFRRRIRRVLDRREVFFQTAEDVVIQKLRWLARIGRPKDREDALDVLDTQRSNLDLSYMRRWCDEHGTRPLLEELLAEADSI